MTLRKSQAEESVFVGRAFNIWLQLAIEKGIVGLLVYCFLFISFYWVSNKKIKLLKGDGFRQSVVILFTCAITAALVRDLSYSSILTNKGVILMLWFMFAENAELRREGNPNKKSSLLGQCFVFGPVLVAGVLLVWADFRYQAQKGAEDSFRQFARELQQGQYVQASSYIEEAVRRFPDNAYYLGCEGLIDERMLQNKYTGNEIF